MNNANKILLGYLKIGVKAAPWVIASMVCFIIIAKQYIKYATPYYQSTAIIKIDEGTVGISKSNLYDDFDLFTAPSKVMTEIEVLKSNELLKKTIKKLDFDIEYYQIGKIKITELFKRSPFVVSYSIINPEAKYQKEFHLTIQDGQLLLDKNKVILFGDTIVQNNVKFLVSINQELLKNNPKIELNGDFKFKINSVAKKAKEFKKNLDITAVDKDISVVRVSFKHKVPEKTEVLVNALAQEYIHDYINTRTEAAKKSLEFITSQLQEVTVKLTKTENQLENYKLTNGIVNTRQETETDLRKLSQLKIQLTNIKMKQAALDSLNTYINSNTKNFLELAPHFEVFGDMLYVELIKKIQGYRAKRKELLVNYTEHSEEIKTLDSKLKDLIAYFKESVKNSKQNIQTQKNQIQLAIEIANQELKNAPTIEKNLTALKREFQQTQKLYNFLSEKKSEATLAKSAGYSFHKILEHGEVPTKPVSPNKVLILFVSGFFGAFLGIAVFYVKQLIFGNKIKTKEEIERSFEGQSFNLEKSNYQSFITKLLLKKLIAKKGVLTINHLSKKQNSMANVEQIATSFAQLGWKTLILNFDFSKQWLANTELNTLDQLILNNKEIQTKEIQNNLFSVPTQQIDDPLLVLNHNNLHKIIDNEKSNYDLIIINAPSILTHIETIKLASISSHTVCLIKKKNTSADVCTSVELIKKEYALNHLSIALEK